MSRKSLTSAVKAFLCLGLIIASAVLTVNYWVNTATVKNLVQDRLATMISRPVSIRGKLGVSLAWRPTVVAGQVVVSGADHSGPDLIVAEKVSLTLKLDELLSGRLSLERIAVRSAAVNLVTDGRGKPSWSGLGSPGTAAGAEGAVPVDQSRLYLEDVWIKYLDQSTAKEFKFHINKLQGQTGPGRPLRFNSTGSLSGQTYRLDLVVGRSQQTTAGPDSRSVAIKSELAGASLNLNGTVAWPADRTSINPAYKLTFNAAVPNPAAVKALLGDRAPVFLTSASLSGRAEGVGLDMSLDQLKGSVGPVDLAGSVDLSVQSDQVRLSEADLLINGGRVNGTVAAGRIPAGWEVKAALQTSGPDSWLIPDSVRANLPPGLSGLGRLDLAFAARGDDWKEFTTNMTVTASCGPVEFFPPGPGSELVCLNELIVSSRPGRMVEALVAGRIGKINLQLAGQAQGIDPEKPAKPAWIDLTGRAPGMELSLRGWTGLTFLPVDAEIRFNLQAKQRSPLAGWLGMSVKNAPPLAAKGLFLAGKGGWTIKDLRANLGRSVIMGRLGRAKSRLNLNLTAPRLDPDQLAAAFKAAPKHRNKKNWPGLVKSADLDIDLNIDRITGDWKQINCCQLKGSIRRGKLDRAPVSFFHGDSSYQGLVSLDLQGRAPILGINLTGRDINLNQVMKQLELSPALGLTAGRIGFDLASTGSTLDQMANSLSVVVKADRVVGPLTLGDWRGPGRVDLSKVTLIDRPGRPTEVTGQGVVSGQQVNFKLYLGAAKGAGKSNGSPIKLKAKINDSLLKTTGRAVFNRSGDRLSFDLDLSGRSLTGLYRGDGVNLPRLGPFHLTGKYSLARGNNLFRDFKFTLGQSRITGRANWSTMAGRPRWAADLKIDRLRMKDFISGETKSVAAEGGAPPPEKSRRGALDHLDAIEGLIRRMSAWGDGRVKASITKIASGPKEIGRGNWTFTLNNGRMELKPFHLELEKGVVDANAAVKPTGSDLDVDVALIARGVSLKYTDWLFDPKSKATGDLSLDAHLIGRTDKLVNLPARSTGHVDFNMKPKSLEAGLIDMWFINLFRLLPFIFGSKSDAVFNCIIGQFDLKDGLMSPKNILIDTTTTRVQGEGWIKLRDRKLDITLYPKAKHPRLFSAPAPVRLSGRFDDFSAGLSKSNLLGTALKFVTSPLRAPLSRLLFKSTPADGVDVCDRSLGRTTKK